MSIINEIKKVDWYFKPTRNKHGKARRLFDIKTVSVCENTLFRQPTMLISDLHSHTENVINLLDQYFNLNEFTILTCGDMAGESIFGSDGIPYPYYQQLHEKCKEFYFVQGNHDLPFGQETCLQNNTGTSDATTTYCYLSGRHSTQDSPNIGKICGANGIISDKQHPYKSTKETYLDNLEKLLTNNHGRNKILMTHDCPYIEKENKGNKDIYELVIKYKPLIHIFGHCHFKSYFHQVNGVNFINADSRIIVMIKNEDQLNNLLKIELEDDFSCYVNSVAI